MSQALTPEIAATVAQIHAAPPRLVLAFAGAGSQALHWLHAVAGSSRTLLEAVDCYAPRSLAAVVGGTPAQAVSVETAAAMADWALARAAVLAEGDWPLLGLGCTAAIATDRIRRGLNRACLALRGPGQARRSYELLMEKGARERAEEEELVSRLILLVIARACGLPGPTLKLGANDRLVED